MINQLIRNKRKVYLYDLNDVFMFEGILKESTIESLIKIEIFSEVDDCYNYFKDNKIFAKDKNGNLLFVTNFSSHHSKYVDSSTESNNIYVPYPKKINENRLHKRKKKNLKAVVEDDNQNEIFIFDVSEKGLGFYSKQNYPEYSNFTIKLIADNKLINITIVRKKTGIFTDSAHYYEYGAVFQSKGIEPFLNRGFLNPTSIACY